MTGNINGNKQVDGEWMQVSSTPLQGQQKTDNMKSLIIDFAVSARVRVIGRVQLIETPAPRPPGHNSPLAPGGGGFNKMSVNRGRVAVI